MTTYLVHGFNRRDHSQNVYVVVDTDNKIGGGDVFKAANALNPTDEICFMSSQNISAAVPDELKNRLLAEAELYARVPELDPSSRRRRRRR
jgi:hypothetical protein